MRRSLRAVAAAALVALVAGGCGNSAGTMHPAAPAQRGLSSAASGAARPATDETGVPRCLARALVLRPGGFVVAMTGEHAVMYALTNRGPVTCTVSGYPKVVLYDAGGATLPFRYAEGGGAYVSSRGPVTMVLARRASAYVLVAKYRCDLGIARSAAAVRLTLPTARRATFAGREAVVVVGAAGPSYCRGGRHDPGQVVAVSPVEPIRGATPQPPLTPSGNLHRGCAEARCALTPIWLSRPVVRLPARSTVSPEATPAVCRRRKWKMVEKNERKGRWAFSDRGNREHSARWGGV
jgi:hypothetical protein